MKLNLNNLDSEDLEVRTFEKIKGKKHKLRGKQSVNRLVSLAGVKADADPKFENDDLNEFYRLGVLDELISDIKTGKEAAVYLGRNREGFVAVKIYTDLRVRSFRRDESYRAGRFIGDARIERAIEQGSRKGLDAHQILWVQEEFRQMKTLREIGVALPEPIAVSGLSLVMEFIGDREEGTPAPRIADLKMEAEEAEDAFRQAVQNLKLILRAGRVHGDYSSYNILWHERRAIIIDFPQVIEFQNNPNAADFLARDVRSLCKSFRKQGIKAAEETVLKEVRGY
jgi:RIO kinase 1